MASGIDVTPHCGEIGRRDHRHRQLGNIDWGLGLAMVGGTMMGVEMGVRLLNYTKEIGCLGLPSDGTVFIMLGLFIYTQLETHQSAKKSRRVAGRGQARRRELKVSKIPLFFQAIALRPIVRCHVAKLVISWGGVIVGIATGVLAGFFGVAAASFESPLWFCCWRTTHIAVGTGLVGNRRFRRFWCTETVHERQRREYVGRLFHDHRSNVRRPVWSIATSFVRGPAIRFILSYSLVLATTGAFLNCSICSRAEAAF